jgi:signal transduction histidine kinase
LADEAPHNSHRLLDRQLAKRGLTPGSLPEDRANWVDFLARVARTYVEAEQGRELLERSLALSSAEMEELYSRQRAISACAQALLFNRDDEAVTAALSAIMKATEASCGWIDINIDTDEKALAFQRKWSICGCGAKGDLEANQLPRLWSERTDVVEALSQGKTPTRITSTGCCDQKCMETYVPITGERGWTATLVIANPGSEPLPNGDLEVLRMAAGMLGSFSDKLESTRRLAEREKELEELIRSKDQLIASISHEIRTPLTAITGYAQLLHEGVANLTDKDRSSYVRTLVDQGNELANIVDDLLVAAKADLGKLTVVRVPVDLWAQSAQVLEGIDPVRASRVALIGPPVKCAGDPQRVRQVIRNLVTNALRYGGPTVEIRINSDQAGGHLLVVDNGAGVPRGHEERVFEAYHRAQETPGLTSALGLGLAITRTLARLMDGDVSYRRDNGHTIFQLDLPVID